MSTQADRTAVLIKARGFTVEMNPERYVFGNTSQNENNISVMIGRYLTNDIVILHKETSNLHATVERRIDAGTVNYYLVDNKSTNGTYINGQHVEGEVLLNHGDCLSFGDPSTVMLEFHIPAFGSAKTEIRPLTTKPSPLEPKRLNWDATLQVFWIDTPTNRLSLSPNEQRLLHNLYNNAGKICSREELAEFVWSEEAKPDENRKGAHLTMLISALRKKLGDTKEKQQEATFLRTARGEGYVLELNPTV